VPLKAPLQKWLQKNWDMPILIPGAMYRAVTLNFCRCIFFDEEIVGKVADEIDITFKPRMA
jgi:cytidylate kinase